jgi:hypothetical protein
MLLKQMKKLFFSFQIFKGGGASTGKPPLLLVTEKEVERRT